MLELYVVYLKNDPYDLVCEDIETEYKDNVIAFNKTFGRHA
jgi:hypothetical protein